MLRMDRMEMGDESLAPATRWTRPANCLVVVGVFRGQDTTADAVKVVGWQTADGLGDPSPLGVGSTTTKSQRNRLRAQLSGRATAVYMGDTADAGWLAWKQVRGRAESLVYLEQDNVLRYSGGEYGSRQAYEDFVNALGKHPPDPQAVCTPTIRQPESQTARQPDSQTTRPTKTLNALLEACAHAFIPPFPHARRRRPGPQTEGARLHATPKWHSSSHSTPSGWPRRTKRLCIRRCKRIMSTAAWSCGSSCLAAGAPRRQVSPRWFLVGCC